MGESPRADGRRKVKLAAPVDLLIDGKPVGRLLSLEVELDELRAPGEQGKLAIEVPTSTHDHEADVWAVYVEVMAPRNKAFGPQERAMVKNALKVATKTELCDAIRGCECSDFHMARGDYAGGKRYNKLSNIIKGKRGGKTDREQIDMMIEYLQNAGSGVTSAEQGKISRAKRDVLDGQTFPGDARVVAKAKEGAAWLEGIGWRVVIDAGTVRFVAPGEDPA